MEERRPMRYIQMMPSIAHTYGNAVAFMQKWIIDQFPKRDNGESIFKTINISSKIAHRQIRRTPNEISKNTKPIIMFTPRIDLNEDRFLKGTLITDRLFLNPSNYAPASLQPFFLDKRNEIVINYQLNRAVMYMDVLCIFSSFIQQTNNANYFKNLVPLDDILILDTCLESYLSQEMMEIVAKLSNQEIESNGSVKKFLNYMNQHSVGPVTYKLQGSTNTREFYRYYPVKIMCQVGSFDTPDGEKNGQISDYYTIRFTCRIEFYTTGFYYLFSDKIHQTKKPIMPDDSSIIPIYTDVILREEWDLKTGWSEYNRASCRLDKINDSVDFKEMLSPSIIAAIKYYVAKDYYVKDIVDIRVREQGKFMTEGVGYTIDYDNFTINFNNKDYGFLTYTIMICINPEEINELIKKLYDLK